MFDSVFEHSEALLTPLVAIIAAYIAWQQAATNKKRLKHELFEKRFELYLKFKAIFLQISQSANIEYHQVEKFLIDTLEIEFLFGKEVAEFRDEVSTRAFDVSMGLHNKNSTGATDDQRHQGYEQHRNGTRWFVENHQELLDVFQPYLTIK